MVTALPAGTRTSTTSDACRVEHRGLPRAGQRAHHAGRVGDTGGDSRGWAGAIVGGGASAGFDEQPDQRRQNCQRTTTDANQLTCRV